MEMQMAIRKLHAEQQEMEDAMQMQGRTAEAIQKWFCACAAAPQHQGVPSTAAVCARN